MRHFTPALLPGLVLVLLLLGGCTVQQAVDKSQATADKAAQANLGLVCATTVGAYFRLQNPQHQEGIRLICGAGGVDLTKPDEAIAEK